MMRDGFVVTPSTRPVWNALWISEVCAVSIKIFIVQYSGEYAWVTPHTTNKAIIPKIIAEYNTRVVFPFMIHSRF
tara:strand:- start:308 stop:532 length:225 start_codon:yes stop_codon:yes gene_type:complete